MTFLQPFILWGIPLILLPILIHLFNRLRHRSIPWAAMMFLRSATRKSTRYARLRQFLILLFRVLAVLVLVLALSRPLAGGWMGWMVASAPDVILILFDRSASMEGRDVAAAQATKREEALKLLTQSARGFEKTSRIVLLENVERQPQEVPAATLAELPLTAPTEAAADIPAMLQTAVDWYTQNRPGAGEIWIASDFQASNWDPESDRWSALAAGMAALPQGIRVRLLGMNREAEMNDSIAVESSEQRRLGGQYELDLVYTIERSGSGSGTVPVTVVLNGARSQTELKIDGQSLRYRQRVPLGTEAASGWGYVELPADANLADNRSYFVYGAPRSFRAALVADDTRSVPFLQFATAPDPANTNQICEIIPATRVEQMNWQDYALVLWQRPAPQGELAKALESYVSSGGVAVFFPPNVAGSFLGAGWGETQNASENGFVVNRWDQQDGPLANSDEGLLLPLRELKVKMRQAIVGDANVIASFEDGAPFLARKSIGKGQLVFCATLPNADWSTLSDGAVLLPMLQRLFQTGGARMQQGSFAEVGAHLAAPGEERWVAVDSAAPKNAREQSGVYRSAARLTAVNRPRAEDGRERVEGSKVKSLFGTIPVRLFEERRSRAAELQSELWRLFLFCMAAFLLIEGMLILPERRPVGDLNAAGGEDAVRGARAAKEPALSEVAP